MEPVITEDVSRAPSSSDLNKKIFKGGAIGQDLSNGMCVTPMLSEEPLTGKSGENIKKY